VFDLRSITFVSGGQTGADRAALDFAIAHDIAHEGWCPRGRLTEDGPLSTRYHLRETPLRKYAQRTEWNVRDSDATVIFSIGSQVRGGTALTRAIAKRLGKPFLHLARDAAQTPEAESRNSAAAILLLAFIAENEVHRLNFAGPRASQEPEVANFVGQVLAIALENRNL
jgi:Circularly permutated YpsA SLOG family